MPTGETSPVPGSFFFSLLSLIQARAPPHQTRFSRTRSRRGTAHSLFFSLFPPLHARNGTSEATRRARNQGAAASPFLSLFYPFHCPSRIKRVLRGPLEETAPFFFFSFFLLVGYFFTRNSIFPMRDWRSRLLLKETALFLFFPLLLLRAWPGSRILHLDGAGRSAAHCHCPPFPFPSSLPFQWGGLALSTSLLFCGVKFFVSNKIRRADFFSSFSFFLPWTCRRRLPGISLCRGAGSFLGFTIPIAGTNLFPPSFPSLSAKAPRELPQNIFLFFFFSFAAGQSVGRCHSRGVSSLLPRIGGLSGRRGGFTLSSPFWDGRASAAPPPLFFSARTSPRPICERSTFVFPFSSFLPSR